MSPRTVITALVLAALAATVSPASARPLPVVVDAVVTATGDGGITLAGGWRVSVDRATVEPHPAEVGHRVRVVGLVEPAVAPRLILASAVTAIPEPVRASLSKHGDDGDDDGSDDGDDGGGGGGGGGGGDDGDDGDGGGGGGGGGDDGGGGGGGGGDDGSDDDDELEIEVLGQLADLLPPESFRLDGGLLFATTPLTRYEDGLGSYADLSPGQIVEVRGRRLPGGDLEADRISLEDEAEDGGRVEIAGTILTVDDAGLTLDGGPRVERTTATRVVGDGDAWEDIEVGWWAEIEAYTSSLGTLQAEEVRLDDHQVATTTGEDYEPQQALVVLAPGSDPDALAQRHGAVVTGVVGELAVLLWWEEEIDDLLLARLDADPSVAAVEPNYHFRDPESVRRRYPIVDFAGSGDKVADQPASALVRAADALALARGTGTVVAVMDTGVDPDHPLLAGRIAPRGLDLVDGDLAPWETRNGVDEDGDGDVDEATGHGTFVASIIVTMAPDARVLPYRVLDDDGGGTAYGLALAIADAIDRQVEVINLSLVYHRRSTAVDLLLERAATRGVVVVASAGNDGSAEVPFPASDSHVIAVTATGDGDTLADFANHGPLIHLGAPGEGIYGALDDGRYGTSSGTSMATPFVAAAAAMLKELDRALDPALAAAVLTQSGRPATGPDWSGAALDMAAAAAMAGRAPEDVFRFGIHLD